MAIAVAETFPVQLDQKSGSIPYIVTTDSGQGAVDVIAAVVGAAPGTFGGLPFSNVTIDSDTGTKFWRVSAKYGNSGGTRPVPPETGDAVLSITTGGATQHITQAIAHVSDYAASGTPPNTAGVIGLGQSAQDGIVGVDIAASAFAFTITRYVAAGDMTPTYIGKLTAYAAHTNNAYFTVTASGLTLDFSEQSCLYLGSKIDPREPQGDFVVVMNFAASPSLTGITVGTITGIAKKGMEYLWVRYDPKGSIVSGVTVPKAADAHVEKVYDTFDFSDLDP